MTKREPTLIVSSLSRLETWNRHRLHLEIYRLDDRPGWTLEVVNSAGTSTVWDNLLDSDEAAEACFPETLKSEGIAAFRDDSNVVPFATRPH